MIRVMKAAAFKVPQNAGAKRHGSSKATGDVAVEDKGIGTGARMLMHHSSWLFQVFRLNVRASFVGVLVFLAGCATQNLLMPTPAIYLPPVSKTLFTVAHGEDEQTAVDLFYMTDRAPTDKPGDPFGYSALRSHSMAFGSVIVEVGEHVAWPALVKASVDTARSPEIVLKLGAVKELGRFPLIPYDVQVVPTGVERSPAVMDVHEKAAAGFQAEIARRLAQAARKEVVIFVHGYNNSFEDAALTMGELCHFLGREFVCGIFTWPAGGDSGILAGYNVDVESGEFAVQHLKTMIRLVAHTPGVERIHLLAHSRGTDVLSTAMREINIESYISGTPMGEGFKIRNMVLMAPDMDMDVAMTKLFGVISDPEMPYGGAPNARGVLRPAGIHMTIYASAADKALTISGFLFGSLARLGRVQEANLSAAQIERADHYKFLLDFIEVNGTPGFVGHNYFHSDRDVSADIVALIRYGLKPGETGRPLQEIRAPFWRIVPRP
jgi:esterase/lipase superfamily enzyme